MFFMCLCCHIMANKDIYIYIYITIYSAGWRWRTIGTGWRNKQACLCILFAFSSLERRSCYLFSHGLTDSFLGAAARPMKSLKGCFLLQHLMYGIGCRLITESIARLTASFKEIWTLTSATEQCWTIVKSRSVWTLKGHCWSTPERFNISDYCFTSSDTATSFATPNFVVMTSRIHFQNSVCTKFRNNL